VAFVVEDGTGLSNSNSYCSVVEFQAYWTDRGFDYSAYTDGQIEKALVRATDHIELTYRAFFRGVREVDDQALSFPRALLYVELVEVEGVPDNLKRATHEYAKRALTVDLDPDLADTATAGGAVLLSETKKVGPIETRRTFQAGGGRLLALYRGADMWLTEYLYGSGTRIRA
jgi:hypothetical protein